MSSENTNFKVIHENGIAMFLSENILNALENPVVLMNVQGIIVYLNRSAEELFGWNSSELVGKNSGKIANASLTEDESKKIIESLQKGDSWSGEISIQKKDQNKISTHVTLTPILDKNKSIDGILACIKDLSEEKRKEQELIEHQSRFYQIFDNINTCVAIYKAVENGKNFVFVDLNMAGEKHSKADRNEIRGKKVTDVFPGVIKIGLFEVFKRVYQTGKPEFLPLQFYQDGRITEWVENFVFKLPSGLIVAIYEDTSEKQQAIQDLRKSEEMFRNTFEQAAVGIAHVSPEGDFILVNKRFGEIIGYTVAELQTMNFREITHPDDLKLDEKYIHKVMKNEISSFIIEKRYIHKKGYPVWISLYSGVIRDADGNVKYAVAVVEDITDRKRNEIALQESEARYNQIFTHMNSGVAVYEPVENGRDFIFKDFNKAAERIDHQKKEELIGKSIFEMRPAAEKIGLIDALRKVFETGEPVHLPITLYKDEHLQGWYENFIYKLPSGEIVAIFDNLTQQKQAEEKIVESESRFRGIFQQSPIGIGYYDQSGICVDVNQSVVEIFGMSSADDAIGFNLFDDPNIPPQSIKKIKRGETLRYIAEFDFSLVKKFKLYPTTKTGKIYTDVIISPIKDRSQTVMGYIGQVRDVTTEKESEKRLEQSEARFKKMIDHNAIPMVITDQNQDIISFNQKFIETYGYTLDDVSTAEKWWQIACPDPEYRAQVMKEWNQAAEKAMEQGTEIEKQIWEITCKDGNKKTVEFGFVSLTDVNIVTMIDITDLKNAEKKLEAVIDELEARNAELEQFTYTVSHDLKSPMISIVGFMGLLKRAIANNDKEEIENALTVMDDNIHRMDKLLKNVLELSRIGRVANPSEWIPFQSIIDQSLDTLKGVIPQSIQITMDNNFPEIYCDESRMVEVTVNLIENAAKFTRSADKPEIHIGIRWDQQALIFYVRDNGIGIDKRYISRIFRLFDKLNDETEGTGVGLTICRRIIEVHGGTIWAESDGLNRGTTICFTLASKACRF